MRKRRFVRRLGAICALALVAGAVTQGTSYTQPVATASTLSTGGQFVPTSPQRIADTTSNLGGFGTTPLQAGEIRNFTALGSGGLPASGVSAIMVDVAVSNQTNESDVTLWAAGDVRPTRACLP